MFTPERGMLAARAFAVLVIVGVGAAAFRLSFATLRDLAELAHIPPSDAWLFPLIIDGTIVQATAGTLVLAKSAERKFFVRTLGVGALVSVAGNSIHAIAAGRALPWWLCAIVAAIAPISLLVDTHGLAVLFRAAQHDSPPATESGADTSVMKSAQPDPVEPSDGPAEPVRSIRPGLVAQQSNSGSAPVVPVRTSRPVVPVAVMEGGGRR